MVTVEVLPDGKAARIAAYASTLAGFRYTEVLSTADSIVSSAMQLAVWELVSGGTNLRDGNFQVNPVQNVSYPTESHAAIAKAQNWLNELDTGSVPESGNYRIVVLSKRNNRLMVATADPADQQAAEKIKFATQMGVDWVIAEYDKLLKLVEVNSATATETSFLRVSHSETRT